MKPGPRVAEEDVKSERLTLRVHSDLIEILQKRADERNMSRSAYVEALLIAWVQADPRNPKIDAKGKYVENAPSPLEEMNKNSLKFGAKWSDFNKLYALLFGQSAPSKWVDEPQDHWMGEG
ncbi:ribbon-helix-helix protein, CopG family [Bradyrhizobium japonicum]|uniref:ribbon-helix-helix protein, CopG family n=1 Tax=Bradyrhizobium japonicum TaxID=375 RepID=UPI0013747547|nr:ribbon-helix-helix protein, CopG family [Bradyrhizobium japonicum]